MIIQRWKSSLQKTVVMIPDFAARKERLQKRLAEKYGKGKKNESNKLFEADQIHGFKN